VRGMTQFELNWRYLAWRRWPDLTWPQRLARLGKPLRDLTADPPAVNLVAEIEGRFEAEHLEHTNMLAGEDLDFLRENLRHLLGQAPYGTHGTLARQMGVSLNTVSRPRPDHLRNLCALLHLPPDLDLYATPLFLTDAPSTHVARLEQVKGWMDGLRPTALQALYPALERLLKEP
jgi:hypothetical protein